MFIKKFLLLIFLLAGVYPIYSFSASAYVFQDVITDFSSTQSNHNYELKTDGGSLSYHVVYNSSCQGTYQMEWTFSKDISTLFDNDEFIVTIQCVVCQDVCGYKWSDAWGNVTSANNILSIPGIDNYEYNGNIEVSESTGSVTAYDSSTYNQTSTVLNKFDKPANDSAFAINIGNNRFYYHYTMTTEEETPTPTQAADVQQTPTEQDNNYINYFLLQISRSLSTDVSVDYETEDDTAIAGQDYIYSKGTATIKAGNTSTVIPIVIIGDDVAETEETFKLNISNPQGANFPDGATKITATRTIQDDD